ncbi:MAG: response regulator [Planctomycetota bacterium]|jgi:CheY-like chemotaxis protein
MTESAKRILVVDDEEDILTYLSAMLSDAGYEVTAARNGREAIEAVRADRPDLVSLDISMPEESGIRFYRNVKEDEGLRSIPVVVVTGIVNPWASKSGEGSLEKFLSSRRQVPPPEGFFEKPVDRERYLAKVAELTS